MGQSTSACKDFIPDAVDNVQFQLKKHGKILQDLNNLSYEDLKNCIEELNELSRKCIDKDGNQLIFAINKGSDQVQWLWKATIKIAAVNINPTSRKINSVKIINLKQFLHIFNTMVTNVKAIQDIEERQSSASTSPDLYPTTIMNQMNDPMFNFENTDALMEDCIICLERRPEVILPCIHQFCTVCIEQWNERSMRKACPICDQDLVNGTQDSWCNLEIPESDEIQEEIVAQLQKITADKT